MSRMFKKKRIERVTKWKTEQLDSQTFNYLKKSSCFFLKKNKTLIKYVGSELTTFLNWFD